MKTKTRYISILAAAAVMASYAGTAALTAVAENTDTSAVAERQAPPEKPDGEGFGGNGGEPPEKPDSDGGRGENGRPDGGGFGGGSAVTEWSAVTEYRSDTSTAGKSYSSAGTDENAIHISGGKVVLNDAAVTRTSSSSTGGDNSSFYGVGAAVLATGGTAYINGGTIDTDSKGGAGVFAYGDGVIYIKDAKITTKQSTSGGIHAAGGGTVYAWDLDVETNGESSAAKEATAAAELW